MPMSKEQRAAEPIEIARARSVALREASARKKYFHTEETDAIIRQAYRQWTHYNNRNAIPAAGRKLGWPKHAVRSRAGQLGLSKAKEKPWTDAEEQIVEKWAFLCLDRISLKLKAAGFHRTETAIHLKMKRLRAKRTMDGWSARALATNFGVDDHKITTWFKRGMLKGHQTGIKVGQNEKLHFRAEDVRHFILHHPEEIDLAKCEKYFLLSTLCPKDLCREFLREVA